MYSQVCIQRGSRIKSKGRSLHFPLEINPIVSSLLRSGGPLEHQENVIYYGTLQTTTEHYVVLCSKIQPTDERQ
ncbi:hypothetical protein M405DRAFT_554620 [Rhizopogon salebrosus TDB-379]|nr:hypothetical protein M405DRAFT_554620 [Rhizopogon salebrosus TDB-379]